LFLEQASENKERGTGKKKKRRHIVADLIRHSSFAPFALVFPVPCFIPSNAQVIHRVIVSAAEMTPRMMIVSAAMPSASALCCFFVR
jgi:hypothetical protein